jgi:hypothetical protein
VLSRFDQPSAAPTIRNAFVDGEVIAPDETGRPQFYDLLRGTLTVAYDLLWHGGIHPATVAAQRAPPAPARHPANGIPDDLRVIVNHQPRVPPLRADVHARPRRVSRKRLKHPYDERTRWYKMKNHNYTQAQGQK